MSASTRRLPRWLFWGAAIFTFVMAALPHPPHIPTSPPDKVQHVIAFTTLGLLAGWAYARTSPWRLAALLSLYGALIELVQAIPALHRDSEWVDWLADTLAAGVALMLVSWWRARRGSPA